MTFDCTQSTDGSFAPTAETIRAALDRAEREARQTQAVARVLAAYLSGNRPGRGSLVSVHA